MRAKTIDLIQDTPGKFVHFNANDMPDFVRDLVGSKKWKSTFGNHCESKIDHEDIFLANLADEYKSCEDKETNKAIPLQMSKQKQKVLHWTNTVGQPHFFIWHNIRCIQVTSGCCQKLT